MANSRSDPPTEAAPPSRHVPPPSSLTITQLYRLPPST